MINIAVIGCGYWGPNLIRHFYSNPLSSLKSICDTDVSRLEHVTSIYNNVHATTKYEEVVTNKEIDAIVIATPVKYHFEMALKSLENGKHVFIEKPMSTSVKNCIELIEMSERVQRSLFVGHTYLYSSAVRKIKELVQGNVLGDLQYISARRLNLGLFQKDINVAWDLAPHDLSIILFLLGQMPVSVNCQGKAHLTPEVEDVTNMTLNFSNGCFAFIQSSWLDPNKVREMTIVGSRRMLIYNDLEPMEKIKIYDKRVEVPPFYDTFAEFQYSYHYGDVYSPYIKQYEPLREEVQQFLESIQTGKQSESCGYEAMKIVQVLEAATKSLKNGGGMVEV
jgi:predicted dehydrogenase